MPDMDNLSQQQSGPLRRAPAQPARTAKRQPATAPRPHVAARPIEPALPAAELIHSTAPGDPIELRLNELMTRTRYAERAEAALKEAMARSIAKNPEEVAMLKSELARAEEEIKVLQRELISTRRATAVLGQSVGRGFWVRMADRMETDAENLIDALEGDDQVAALKLSRVMADSLLEFAGNCQMYGEAL
jgi:hypothetical protein